MKKAHWKERYANGGICDFKKNYDFYFKWLLNKVCECFYIDGLPDTVDEWYLKTNLILDGDICITDFDSDLYACVGAPGGPPDAYYVPTLYVIANPVLGSKQVTIGKDGVVIYNTSTDRFYQQTFASGLYELINQTATLLSDNIVSINCNQINSRVAAIFTADSEAQAIAGEIILKKLYAGAPYQILRSDLIDKINVNPLAGVSTSQNLSELIELHNYIIAQFFQSIGIKSNDIRKKSHVLQDEIDEQNDYLQISILEILTSWQKGFDKVNALYDTDIKVRLNPVLVPELVEETQEASVVEEPVESNEAMDEEVIQSTEPEEEPLEDTESLVDEVLEGEGQIEDLIDVINDEGGEEDDTEDSDSEDMGRDTSERLESDDST